MRPLALEIIACSVEDAAAAALGGAHRLEVVRDLDRDGLTPPVDLVRRIQREVALPLRVMVRESEGFACRSGDERRALVDQAAAFDALGVDGIVVGWTRGGAIDEETLGAVLEAAPSIGATFHRAFDSLTDPRAALRALQHQPRVDRVLTAAGRGAWAGRGQTLADYASWGRPRIGILPGGGIDGNALRALAACGAVTEAHVGRAARVGHAVGGAVSATMVSELRRAAGWRD
jgi:copper homeostasis protein